MNNDSVFSPIWNLLFIISYYLVPVGSILSVIGVLRNTRHILLTGIFLVSIAGVVFSITEIICFIYRICEKYKRNKNSNKPL